MSSAKPVKKKRCDAGEEYARECIARELGVQVVKHDDNSKPGWTNGGAICGTS